MIWVWQRLPRVIGVEKAWSSLRTGGTLSGRDAVDCGLISAEVDGDLRAEAIRLAALYWHFMGVVWIAVFVMVWPTVPVSTAAVSISTWDAEAAMLPTVHRPVPLA